MRMIGMEQRGKAKQIKEAIGKTRIRRQYSMGVGTWDATLKDAKLDRGRSGKEIVKLTFSDNNSNREGIYIIPMVGKVMDCMIENVFDDGEEEIYLEDMIGYKFKIEIERNGDFLNIASIEVIDEDIKEEVEEYEESDEDDLELDFDFDYDYDYANDIED